jgi:hypothetical protein
MVPVADVSYCLKQFMAQLCFFQDPDVMDALMKSLAGSERPDPTSLVLWSVSAVVYLFIMAVRFRVLPVILFHEILPIGAVVLPLVL